MDVDVFDDALQGVSRFFKKLYSNLLRRFSSYSLYCVFLNTFRLNFGSVIDSVYSGTFFFTGRDIDGLKNVLYGKYLL